MVIDFRAGQGHQTAQQFAAEGLAAADNAVHAAKRRRKGGMGQICRKAGRREGQKAHAIARNEPRERIRRLLLRGGGEHHRLRAEKCRGAFDQKGIKAGFTQGQDRAGGIILRHCLRKIAKRAVRDHHALGRARGTGGVDKIGRILRPGTDRRGRSPVRRRILRTQARDAAAGRIRDQHCGAAARQNFAQAALRQIF